MNRNQRCPGGISSARSPISELIGHGSGHSPSHCICASARVWVSPIIDSSELQRELDVRDQPSSANDSLVRYEPVPIDTKVRLSGPSGQQIRTA